MLGCVAGDAFFSYEPIFKSPSAAYNHSQPGQTLLFLWDHCSKGSQNLIRSLLIHITNQKYGGFT